MTNDEMRSQANTTSSLIKIAGILWFAAFMVVMIGAIVFIALAFTSGDYYANSKAVRDAAEAGSGLLSQLGNIKATGAWVMPFAFLGISLFIAGFGFAFSNILRNINLRAGTMAATLPELRAKKNQA
ncbi:MAG: hypothetical protein O2821_10005 [Chloroflexi bacterium]|nr:hypothetical protein [Chloroflexota bacterium]MDA1228692.1 hypothetical protein [Chloroflexota bacterium]